MVPRGSSQDRAPTYQRRTGRDQGRRWYVWQISFRGRPEMMKRVAHMQQRLEAIPDVQIVPPRWLRLHLCTVGDLEHTTYTHAHALAEVVANRVQQIQPQEIQLGKISWVDDRLVLPVRANVILGVIQEAISASATEIADLDTGGLQSATTYEVVVGLASTADAQERALDALTSANLADQEVRSPVVGVSHVLLNRDSFVTDVWTPLDRFSLHDARYQG